MEIQILKENLVKAMQAMNKFALTKVQLPILTNVLIEVDDQGIFFTTTNLEVGLRLRVAGKVMKKGKVAVPAKVLFELAQRLPLGGVSLSETKEGLHVSSGSVKARVQTSAVEDFPPFPEVVKKQGKLTINAFSQAFNMIGYAVSTDEARPTLTGFLWRIEEGSLVATDGYRLSKVDSLKAWEVAKMTELLIAPGKAMGQLLQVMEDFGVEECDFGYDEQSQQLLFSGEELRMAVRVLSGDYPNYSAILPKTTDLEIQVSREELLNAVKVTEVFSRDSANIVKLTIDDKGMELSANAAQVGENKVRVEIRKIVGDAGEIAFNSRYLSDFLTHSEVEQVGIKLTDALRPGLFYEVGNNSFVHVIMPVRVRE